MSDVEVEFADGVAVLTIDRPHARNAIALSTITEIENMLNAVTGSDASVLVIRGGGERAFVSGGDLKELSAIRDVAGAADMARRMRRVLDRVSTLPVPVIGAINGSALGGGAELAVACDMRIAAADVKIGFTQVKLAIMPAWGGAERLAELVGRSKAMLLIGTGRAITAAEALRLGLVDDVVERVDFEAGWRALARQFADLPPSAARAIKSVVASARPHHHPHLETAAVAEFAKLWVADSHWTAAAGLAVGSKSPPAPVPAG
jgi:enoyl-CoA hydratase/carnithine racemase